MAKPGFILLTLFLSLFCSCTVKLNEANSQPAATEKQHGKAAKNAATLPETVGIENNQSQETAAKNDNSRCESIRRNDLELDKKQTFALDFKPFEKSCFVTFHDPEFTDPALGSQFFIYRNGVEVFEFPEQFGGGNATCWVDAVAFEDVNADQLKDVVVVGKCGAKSGSYNENMVYLNTGSSFATNAETNAEIMDFSKVSQIRDFVKKNPKMFVP